MKWNCREGVELSSLSYFLSPSSSSPSESLRAVFSSYLTTILSVIVRDQESWHTSLPFLCDRHGWFLMNFIVYVLLSWYWHAFIISFLFSLLCFYRQYHILSLSCYPCPCFLILLNAVSGLESFEKLRLTIIISKDLLWFCIYCSNIHLT